MKKICVMTLLLLLSVNISFADDDDVFLNTKKSEYNLKSNTEITTNLKNSFDKNQFDDKSNYLYTSEEQVSKKRSASYKNAKKFKNIDYGAEHDTSFTHDDATYSRTLYSKHHIKDNFSIDTSYKTTLSNSAGNSAKSTVSIGPEYRFNKHFAVSNKYSNMSDKSQKGELSIKVNPLKDTERMDFNAGVGHVQHSNGSPTSSQFNFGTNFRF